MTKRMPKVVASLLSVGLIIGGVATGSGIANAAPANPSTELLYSFQDVPGVAELTAPLGGQAGAVFTIQGIEPSTPISVIAETATAAAPNTFATYRDYGVLVTGNDTHNLVVQAATQPDGVTPLAAGDYIRFTISYGNPVVPYVYLYKVPATGSSTGLLPAVQIVGTYTPQQAATTGIPVSISNLDTHKMILVETSVARANNGGQSVVIKREYIQPSAFTSDTYTATVFGFSDLDTSAQLAVGDAVVVHVYSGAGFSNNNAIGSTFLVATPTTPVVTPTGDFNPANPTAAQLQTGAPYVIENLDSTKANVAHLYAAPASDPTNFTQVGTSTIASGNIVGGSATINVSAFYAGTPTTPLNEGDVVQVRLTVDGGAEAILTTYVVPGITPPIPADPTGVYAPASPTAAMFLAGTTFSLSNLDANETNVLSIYTKGVTGNFELLGTHTVDNSAVVAGKYDITVQGYYLGTDGTTKLPLRAGETVRIALSVDGAPEVVLSDYVIPAETTPSGDVKQLANTGSDELTEFQPLIITMGGFLLLGIALMVFKGGIARKKVGSHVA